MLINTEANHAQQFANALESGDNKSIADAWQASMDAIADNIRADFEVSQLANDSAILAQRGYRSITAPEQKFYDALKQAARSTTPKQTFLDLIGDGKDEDLMPVTIIEDAFKDLEQDHKLLQVIKFQYTGYATKWIRNKHESAKAVWGEITDAIKKEITSDLDLMKIENNKLSAFVTVPLDILDMGYTFIDAYVRACLKEAVYDGLEYGIVAGKGVKSEPVGLNRDVHEGVSINSSTGYPEKTAIKVASFDVKEYCTLVAQMAKTESGKPRKIANVGLIVNPTDYLIKIKPATTLLTQIGYVGDMFPFPTDIIQSTEIEDGKAIMFIPNYYTFCVGGKRNGAIEFDDSIGFLDDTRTFKIVQHGDGIADDNTCALVLDISDLDTLIPVFKAVTEAGGSLPTA